VVSAVEEGSPAEGAGIQTGDLIREVNRARIRGVPDFERAVRALKPGDRVTILLQRSGQALFVAFTAGRG
jgi:S1-C subfamily serine protease